MKDIQKTIDFLETMCNVDTTVPAKVYMAIMSGKNPHATFMGSGCVLGHMLDTVMGDCAKRMVSILDMENATLRFSIELWEVRTG